MGTPHVGSAQANWATALTRLASVLRRTNSEIVQVLEPGSEMLANLQQGFHTMLEDYRRNHSKTIEMFCFYEELAVRGIGKVCFVARILYMSIRANDIVARLSKIILLF
jgi:hypothetical protein